MYETNVDDGENGGEKTWDDVDDDNWGHPMALNARHTTM